jgi:RNA polymerase sigma-70 factor (ECF subfamily)
MDSETSVDLLNRWRDGDQSAATQMFERYVSRLCALARSRLSKRMQRRVEAEDIVQSVYRSFFRKAEDNFVLEKEGDLWRLLAAITVNKVRGQVEFHTAKKRGIDAEQSIKTETGSIYISPEAIADEPEPDDAAVMIEELSSALVGLDETRRAIVELSMQNQTVDQIAESVQRSQRTVRRTIQQFRDELESRLLKSKG